LASKLGWEDWDCKKCSNGLLTPYQWGMLSKPGVALDVLDICDCRAGDSWRKHVLKLQGKVSTEEELQQAKRTQQQRVMDLFPNCAIPRNFREYTIVGYEELVRNDIPKRRFLAALQNFINNDGRIVRKNTGEIQYGLLAHGPSGVGKTGALTCLYMWLRERGKSGLWITFHQLLDVLRDFNDPRHDSRLSILNRVDVLLIDEFGDPKGTPTDFQINSLFDILKVREEEARTTLITTNLDVETLRTKFDERSIVRLERLCAVVDVGGAAL